jgi:hypothetical protein
MVLILLEHHHIALKQSRNILEALTNIAQTSMNNISDYFLGVSEEVELVNLLLKLFNEF